MWSCLAKALGFVGAGEEKSGRRPSQAKRGWELRPNKRLCLGFSNLGVSRELWKLPSHTPAVHWDPQELGNRRCWQLGHLPPTASLLHLMETPECHLQRWAGSLPALLKSPA